MVLAAAIGVPFVAAQVRDVLVNPNFTGTIYVVKENSTGSFAHYRFEPGAHTKWHVHEMGQVILCEEGVCHSQLKGGPVIELHTAKQPTSRRAFRTGRARRRKRVALSSTSSAERPGG